MASKVLCMNGEIAARVYASAVRLLTNAHWPSLLHSLVRVMLTRSTFITFIKANLEHRV